MAITPQGRGPIYVPFEATDNTALLYSKPLSANHILKKWQSKAPTLARIVVQIKPAPIVIKAQVIHVDIMGK